MKVTVLIQDVAHVVNAEGSVTYRTVSFDLTPEQQEKIKLKSHEFLGTVIIDIDTADL